ncbi:MAG: nucleoside recognition domain-containing protein [Thermodesulfobacteriota bacterium]
MNTVWILLMVASVLFSFLNGRLNAFTKAIFDGAKSAVEVSLVLLGIVCLWLGITKIVEDSGLIHRLSRFFQYFVRRLFKNIPPDHPAIASITLNFLANVFGLGNAATPLGIKAMQDLKTLHPGGETISFEMMLFIVINTASIQLIPFTVIGILADYGSREPSAIVLPTLLATFLSALFAIGILFAVRRMFK